MSYPQLEKFRFFRDFGIRRTREGLRGDIAVFTPPKCKFPIAKFLEVSTVWADLGNDPWSLPIGCRQLSGFAIGLDRSR